MKYLTFILLLFCSLPSRAQKENNVWIGGENVGLDFNSGTPVVFERPGNNRFWRTNASVCDSSGSLLFYTNGYRIWNKDLQVMQNGNNLNIGDYVTWGYNLLSVHDGAAIIPFLANAEKFYVLHTDLNIIGFDTFETALMPTNLFYCIVDMNLSGGLGGVVAGQKDIAFLSDTLTQSGFKLVKHANGRDYWLLCHKAASSKYFRFLIDPYGIHGPYLQEIGISMNGEDAMGYSPLAFTTDCSKAAQLSSQTMTVTLYDFDRCTGLFMNAQSILVSDSLYFLMDLEFSSSQRYLYVSGNWFKNIWQFDLLAPDVSASKQLVGIYGGSTNPFPTDFDKLCLGPDGKIYVSSAAANRSLSVINYPDSAGVACNVVENAIQLYPPGFNWSGLPNVVNYSLGALVGSGCDSLTSTSSLPTTTFTFGVYPNPFTNELQLTVTGVTTKANLEITNVLGQQVYHQTFTPSDYTVHQVVDLSDVASGMYFVTLSVNDKIYSRKLVKN